MSDLCRCGHTKVEHDGPYDDCGARCLCNRCSPGTSNDCWCGGYNPGEPVDFLRPPLSLGDDYELREVSRWTVHCKHCGHQLIGDTPQTDKAFQVLKVLVEGRVCRNPACVRNGGNEKRRKDNKA